MLMIGLQIQRGSDEGFESGEHCVCGTCGIPWCHWGMENHGGVQGTVMSVLAEA